MSSYKNRTKRQSPNIATKAKSELVKVDSVSLDPPAGNIFAKWWKVLTRPRVATFASEMPDASWASLALGIVLYAVAYLLMLIIDLAVLGKSPLERIAPILQLVATNTIVTMLGILVISGIVYLISRLGDGTGDFKTQTYLYYLYAIPLSLISSLLGLLPGLGSTIPSLAIAFYAVFLTYYMVQAAHRLSPGDALRVVMLTFIAQIIITVILLVAFVELVLNSVHLGI